MTNACTSVGPKLTEYADPGDGTHEVIGAAMEVHTHLGPGLLESVYEQCLCREFDLRNISYERQVALPVSYKGEPLDAGLRLDIVVENRLIVELKATERIHPLHEAQLLTYMKLSNKKVGLILNFNAARMKDGIKRMVL